MEFIVSELNEQNFEFKILQDFKEILLNVEGYCFLKHHFFADFNDRYDAFYLFLVISPIFGTIIIDVTPLTIENISVVNSDEWIIKSRTSYEINIEEDGEDKIYTLFSYITKNRILRKFSEKDERLKGKYMIYFPNIFSKEWTNKFGENSNKNLLFKDTIESFFNEIKMIENKIPDEIWKEFSKTVTGFSNLLKKRLRSAEDKNTYAWIIRKVEEQIQTLEIDDEQIKIGQQIADGPQRIRGLAGTGKTIILAMKAAYMHYNHPEWNIVYTFNTQSLYGFIQDLIERFYKFFSNGGSPDWNKLRILHGWGGKQKEGLYSYIAKIVGQKLRTFSEARTFLANKKKIELLGNICIELINKNNISEMFDAILIDEAQDFHKGFYQLAYKVLKSPKRLIWAYDELQSLEDVNIPTAKDIFGVDNKGIPLVDLDGVYSGHIEKDFVLYKTYRNPRIVLMLAHFFGMGIFRKNGAIQFLPKKEAWEDMGYEIISGNFETGSEVVITRPKTNSPNPIESYVSPQDLFIVKSFNNKNEELEWIANEIYKDINEKKLMPEDILVIGLNDTNLFKYFKKLKIYLQRRNINAFIIGEDKSKDIFKIPNTITLSTVFKAKGNEANKIYIFNFENSEEENNIIQSRNMAFTSITRTRGWVTITGKGNKMKELEEEILKILNSYPEIKFKVPDINKIKRYLDNIEYEKRRARIRGSEEKLKKTLEYINRLKGENELSDEIIEMMKKTIRNAEKGKDK